MTLPSGIVTFLFTDVERSTQTVEALGNERYAELQSVHRDLLRKAFTEHEGHEVGTEGDSFFVAFARPRDALAAAIAGQSALAAHDWPDGRPLRVRMGIHTGEALVRDGDYVGHDVHKAKRIQDAGHGGQILLSQTTADLVGGAELVDLGAYRLKDLGEPQRIFQVGTEKHPPLRTLESFRHNLPTQRTAFIGREKEIAEIVTLLENERLVTLTGVGGCGKTRLAQQVGAETLDRYPDGVFFVDLAQVADPDIVLSTIAAAIGVPIAGDVGTGAAGGSTETVLFNALAARNGLLILDNCEHLLDVCADFADRVLADCPGIRLLATSREALEVDGERPWRVPSLSLPADDDVTTSEAVTLFKTRAQTVRPDFDLTPQNIDAVAEICQRLDGIPLAIEFAAARVSHLSPPEIAARLGDMFRLLAGPRRRMQRQQTLQAALDWSHDLLAEPERILLRRLAVFPASFSLDAAEAICTDERVQAATVLDLLASLVAKSLVTTEETKGTTRYRLIETVRQYAAEKLRVAQESDAYRARHRDHYADWISAFPWDDVLFLAGSSLRILSEEANLRAALEWSGSDNRLDLVFEMAPRMMSIWTSRSPEEGARWLTIARPEDVDIPSATRVAALAHASFLTNILQQKASAELAERAVAAGNGEPSAPLARAHLQRAFVVAIASRWANDPELAARARREADEAERMARGSPNLTRMTTADGRAIMELILGDVEAAARAAARASTEDVRVVGDFSGLTAIAHIRGDHEAALESAERALMNLRSELYDRGLMNPSAPGPVAALAHAGRIDDACMLVRLGLETAHHTGRPGHFEDCLVAAAALAVYTDSVEIASKLLGCVRARTTDVGRIMTNSPAFAMYEHYVRVVRAAMDPDDARRCLAEGRALTKEEAFALAQSLVAEAG